MVAIGGVGGSGTRVVAQMLKELGYFIGNDLNSANDNLLFTLLFKREDILVKTDKEIEELFDIFIKVLKQSEILNINELNNLKELASVDRPQHKKEWLQEREKNITHQFTSSYYGWKEPNTHIVIERLFKLDNNLKFIYVYRNGLDMAYSANQNQLKLWGNIFFNEKNVEINPQNSLKYWCMVHKRVLKLKEEYSNRVYMLDFDDLCINSEKSIKNLLTFLSVENFDVNILKNLVKKPDSIGRYKKESLSNFNNEDLEFIKNIYIS